MIYLAVLALLCVMPAFFIHGKDNGYIVDHPDNIYEPVTHDFGNVRVMRMAPWGVEVPTMVHHKDQTETSRIAIARDTLTKALPV